MRHRLRPSPGPSPAPAPHTHPRGRDCGHCGAGEDAISLELPLNRPHQLSRRRRAERDVGVRSGPGAAVLRGRHRRVLGLVVGRVVAADLEGDDPPFRIPDRHDHAARAAEGQVRAALALLQVEAGHAEQLPLAVPIKQTSDRLAPRPGQGAVAAAPDLLVAHAAGRQVVAVLGAQRQQGQQSGIDARP